MTTPDAPIVTVLTTVWNGAKHLPASIDSVRAQTFDDWELLIVDDASDDDTPNVIAEFAALEPRIRSLRRDDRGGPYVAANTGIAMSRGRYIARLDADDLAQPGRLHEQIAFLERHRELRACGSAWTVFGDPATDPTDVRRFPIAAPRAMKWAVCVVSGLVHSTLMVERDALAALGGYAQLPAAADYGLWCALSRSALVGMVQRPLVAWRQHPEQMSASRLDLQRSISIDLLGAHLTSVDPGGRWACEDVEALWGVGRWWDTDLAHGMRVLDRWQELWLSDVTLSARDRVQLFLLTNRIRARHVKRNGPGRLGPAFAAWARGFRLPFRR